MCTSVILYRKEHRWPLILGSNRDESFSRKSKFPGRHWQKSYPQIIGGFDISKKGSWIALNDEGIFSVIHNRELEKDNDLIKKSRGQIILDILKNDNIKSALETLSNIDQSYFNGFNIILGNRSNCYWAKHISVDNKIIVNEINEGLSVLTNNDLNDLNDKKINYYLNKFSHSSLPDPDNNDWLSWELLLATEKINNQNRPEQAICFIDKDNNYGTKSSSLIALSNIFTIKQAKPSVVFRATANPPNRDYYIDVEME